NRQLPEMASAPGIIAESQKLDSKTESGLKSSEAYYSKVIASAHENIGLLRAGRQDFRGAAEQFELAAKRNPQLDRINFNWGLAAYKAGLYKEAIAPLEKELAANPADIAAAQLLGMSHFSLENYPNAAELLGTVVASRPDEAS